MCSCDASGTPDDLPSIAKKRSDSSSGSRQDTLIGLQPHSSTIDRRTLSTAGLSDNSPSTDKNRSVSSSSSRQDTLMGLKQHSSTIDPSTLNTPELSDNSPPAAKKRSESSFGSPQDTLMGLQKHSSTIDRSILSTSSLSDNAPSPVGSESSLGSPQDTLLRLEKHSSSIDRGKTLSTPVLSDNSPSEAKRSDSFGSRQDTLIQLQKHSSTIDRSEKIPNAVESSFVKVKRQSSQIMSVKMCAYVSRSLTGFEEICKCVRTDEMKPKRVAIKVPSQSSEDPPRNIDSNFIFPPQKGPKTVSFMQRESLSSIDPERKTSSKMSLDSFIKRLLVDPFYAEQEVTVGRSSESVIHERSIPHQRKSLQGQKSSMAIKLKTPKAQKDASSLVQTDSSTSLYYSANADCESDSFHMNN